MANVVNTAQEAVKEKKKKKERAQKAPRVKAEKKPFSPLRAALMTFLFMLFLLSVATALLYFDLLDSRQIAVSALTQGENPHARQIDQLTDLSSSIAADSRALDESRALLEDAQKNLERREKDLVRRETALAEREETLAQQEEEFTLFAENMDQLVAIYGQMPAAQCAKIMTQLYDVEDIVRILERLEGTVASQILAALDPAIAARVTELMLN